MIVWPLFREKNGKSGGKNNILKIWGKKYDEREEKRREKRRKKEGKGGKRERKHQVGEKL